MTGRPIRIAHLSDLHARASSAFDQQRIVTALIADLEAQHALAPIDIAVISGDLAFGGTAEDFALAKQLVINPLNERLNLSMERIIVVPGNHDVNRGKIIGFLETGLKAELSSREAVNDLLGADDRLALATARLDDWHRFHAELYADVALGRPGPLAVVHRLDVDGTSVGIAALNSAWRAEGGEGDRRELLIGDRQMDPALDAIADTEFAIAVVHHPLDWLKPFDGDRARQYLQNRQLVVLTGHEHSPDPQSVIGPAGRAVYSRAGCLYEKHGFRNSYSLLELSEDHSRVTIYVRDWYAERETGVFDVATRVAAQGRVVLPWSANEMTLASRLPFSQVTGALAAVVQDTSLVSDVFPTGADVGVEDLLVPPRFLKLPYQEALAASTIGQGIAPELVADPPDVGPGDVVIVCAEPELGVTSAILWLLGRQYVGSGQELPVYLPSDLRVGTERTERALVEAAARAGYSRTLGGLPPLVIGIDDVSARKPNRLARMASYVAAHRDNGYILGCHGADHAVLAEALSSAGVETHRVFLAPFGRKELRELVRKVVGYGESEMVNRIFRLIRTQGLPRSPLIMAALIARLPGSSWNFGDDPHGLAVTR